MDLSYGERYEALRAELRAFLTASWPPSGADAALPETERVFAFRRRAIEAGWLARSIPKQYGGSEQKPDPLAAQVIREEFARHGAPGDARGIGTMMLVPTLLDRGAEWQKEKWVPDTVLGRILWCQGYSEPGSGSDLASLRTRAVLDGDHWVIDGQKIWTSDAHRADYMFCLCRTEPDAPKHAGISYLLIDMKQPGIDVRPLRQMTGGVDFNEVFLTGVRTPKDWIVGKRGEGWQVSRTTLKHERNSIGNADLAKMQFDALVALAKQARIDGKPAIESPEIRQRLAKIEGYVQAHLYSSYRQLTDELRGRNPGVLMLMVKLNYTNIGQEIGKLALDLLGDRALLDPSDVERHPGAPPDTPEAWLLHYMASLGVAIAGGSANIQRNVIAERGFGLPRDAFAQRSQ
ncbi:MAG TPA: acyl-CoA dehydrogenase family protein [Myxococcota bacterium]|nr:acyl-CoA dehydrogenase family protein [Myxococcota bacterium]